MPRRSFEVWTEEEEAGLRAGWLHGSSIAELADRHERTWGAVSVRLQILGFEIPTNIGAALGDLTHYDGRIRRKERSTDG